MRPQIPESLAERIEAVYEEAGYGSESELVRDAVRQWINELEQRYTVGEGPSNLLVHLDREDLEFLKGFADWEPSEELPEGETGGQYPIVVTFEDLRELHIPLQAYWSTKVGGEPAYKHDRTIDEEDLIRAMTVASKITQIALQQYFAESGRRSKGPN